MNQGESTNGNILELRKVTKVFGGLTAVDDVSFGVRQRGNPGVNRTEWGGEEHHCQPDHGSLQTQLGEHSLPGRKPPEVQANQVVEKGICRTFQVEKPLLNMTVTGNVLIGALLRTPNRKEALEQSGKIIERVGLGKVAHILAKNLTVQDRKRLELARSLATRPTVLLLDEVMAGLTPWRSTSRSICSGTYGRRGLSHSDHRACDAGDHEYLRPDRGAGLREEDR